MSGSGPIRREQRVPFRTRVKVRCDSWERVVALYSQNISRGGMFVRTDNPPAPGTDLVVQLGLPDGRTLELPASVAHVVSPERARIDQRPPGMGVFFKPLDDAKRELLEEIVEEAQRSGSLEVDADSIEPHGMGARPATPAPATARVPVATPYPVTFAGGGARAGARIPSPRPAASTPAAPMATPAPVGTPAAAPPADELDEEAARLLAALEAELGRLRELRPWEALGIPLDAPEEEIGAAYRNLCKRYHPDVFGSFRASEVRAAASDCFIVIKKSYERLIAMRKAVGSAVSGAPATTAGAARPSRPPVAPIVPPAPAPPPAAPPVAAAFQPRPRHRDEPVVVGPPVAAPPTHPPPSFRVPMPTPRTAAPITASPPPPVADEFVPTPTNLSVNELFGDLSGPVPAAVTAPRRSPGAAASAAGGSPGEEGIALYRAKNWRDGRTKLAEALRRDPRNRPLRIAYHMCVGFDLREQGRDDEARKQFESVLVLDPENAEAVAALRSQSADRRETKRSFLKKLLDRE